MPNSIKVAIVVLVFGFIVFRLAKPIALQFSTESDYNRRRNIWLSLSVLALLSPGFWLWVLVAAPTLYIGARKDANPLAFYFLMFQLVPAILVPIPMPGMNEFFSLDIYRLMAFCVLIPTARHLKKTVDPVHTRSFRWLDLFLIGYGLMQILLFVPPDVPGHVYMTQSLTGIIRSGVLWFLDIWILYYVVSRFCSNRKVILEAQAAFCLACVLLSVLAVFESFRHWLLYSDLAATWSGDPGAGFYLMRGQSLRAQVTTGHALALGYLIAIGFGFWLNLQSYVQSKLHRIVVTALLWLGLIGAYSRGPWVGAIVIYFAYSALRPRAFTRLLKATLAVALLGIILLLSPLGERIVDVVPALGGSVDSGSFDYRQKVAERSWQLIAQHPLFGDQLAYFELNDLRQGQGIIDLVNTYVSVTLFYGFVGLTLFVGLMLQGAYSAYRRQRESLVADAQLALLGASLLACIAGTLVMIASCSLIFGYQKMFYILAALAAAYGRLEKPLPGRAQPRTAAARLSGAG